jgi:uncharacterized repeat protein (TIGR03803 family)
MTNRFLTRWLHKCWFASFSGERRSRSLLVSGRSRGRLVLEELEGRWLPSASQVVFLTAPQTLTAGQTSALITLQLEDSSGNAATASSDTTFSLSTTSTMDSFLDSTGHALVGNSLTIPAGSSSAGFEYLDLNSGTPSLMAAGGGFSATQQETVNTASTQLASLYSFNPGSADPVGNLVEDSSGDLFGTTASGGPMNDGTVFEVARGSGTITTIASFTGTNGANPEGLIVDSNGNLFGTTQSGGAVPGLGTVFDLARGSSTITTLASFTGPSTTGVQPNPGLIEDTSGNLFGTTAAGGANGNGTVFELVHGGSTITTLASFSSAAKQRTNGGLVEDTSGNLFGTLISGGAASAGGVFKLAKGSSTITTVASFNNTNGAIPNPGLFRDSSGNLFGTTQFGGTGSTGTVFELAKGSGTITTLASFSNATSGTLSNGGLIGDASGNLFGTAQFGGAIGDGFVFELAKGSSTITTLDSFNGSNGTNPMIGVIEDTSGNLFGTSGGGTFGGGTVFELVKGSGTITSLVSFNDTYGANPKGNLIADTSGNLYGTTTIGGTSGDGEVFELPKGSNTITTRASFNYTNGDYAQGNLVLDSSGNLFGTTLYGGANGDGTIFEVAQGSGTITVLASFDSSTGGNLTTLIEDPSGNFFGTTQSGGTAGDGSIFELAKGSSTITTLASFNGTNGSSPLGSLIEDANGNLFGTTSTGGTGDGGTVFEVSKGSNTIRTLASFNYTNGINPSAGLIEDASGNFFGTTSGGGANGDGAIFELAQGSSTITTLATFNGSNGIEPDAALIADSAGDFFGTTSAGGANSNGTVLELGKGSSTITTLASFNSANGANPQASVVQDTSGNLFGITESGGTYGGGALFEIVPSVGAQLAFTTAPQLLMPQVAATLTVQLKNQNGVTIAASADVMVTLSSTSSSGVFLSGGSPVTSVTIPAGSGGVTFQYKDTVAGTPTLTASASGLSSAKQQEGVTAVATSLVFGVLPSNTTAGSVISPAVTVAVLDQNGNLLSTDNTDLVTLTIATGPGNLAGTTTIAVSGGIATFSNLVLDTPGSHSLSESATGGLTGPNSNSFTINPVSMNHLSFSVQPSNTMAGSAVSPAVQVEVLDQNNSLVTTDNSDQVTLTVASVPGGIASGGTATVSGGIATFSNLILDTAGSYTLAESGSGGLTGANSSSFTVAALGADHVLFGTQPSTTAAGSAINPAVTVEVVDKFGNLVSTDNSDQVTISVASGPGGFASSPTPVTVSSGVASFGNLTLDTAGSYTLSAATTGLTGVTSSGFSVTAADADHLNISVQPSNTTAGAAISPAVKVQVLDKFGNLLTSDNSDQVTLSLAASPAGGGFASNSTMTVSVSGGIATFSKVILNTAGNYALAVSGTGGLSGPNSASFTVSPSTIGKLFFSAQPSNTTAGSTLPAVQVEVLDTFGNALAGDNSDTVTLILNNANKGPSVFNNGSNALSATVSGGFASFSNLVINTAGSYSLSASSTGGATGAPSNSFTISPAAVSSFAVSSKVTSVAAGTGFNISILAKDMFGNNITNFNKSTAVNLTSNDGQTVTPSSVKLKNGSASPRVTLSSPGSIRLTASAMVAGVVIRGSTGTITISPGNTEPGPGTAPTEYTGTLYISASAGGSVNVLTPSVMFAQDAAAGAVGVPVSVIEDLGSQAANDAAAQQFFANRESILEQQDGLAVGMSITTVNPQTGSNSVMETPVGQTIVVPVSFPPIITAVSGPGTPGAVAAFSLAFPQGVSGVNSLADTPDPVTVTALDANGNVVISYTGTVTLSSTDPQFGQPITYTFASTDQGSHTFYVYLNTAGIQSLTVMESTQSGQTAGGGQVGPQDSGAVMGQGLVNIMPDTAVSLVLNAPGTITAGSAEGITVTAVDAFGNVAAGYTGTVTFSGQFGGVPITGLPGSYTFTAADQGSHLFPVTFKSSGSQTITVSDSKDLSLISQAQVQITAAPAKLVITSQPPPVVLAGSNFGLVVEAVDSHGTVNSAFNGLVTMTVAANPAHGSLAGAVTVQAVNGVATFSGLTLNRAGGGYRLTAGSGTVTMARTGAIGVIANAPSQFVVIAQPLASIGAGKPFGLKVAAEDGFGNVISSVSGIVTLALASGPIGAEVFGSLVAPLVKGMATFPALIITQAGTGYSLTASGALTAVTTNLFNVTVGAARKLSISARPKDGVKAGSAFGLVIKALDAYGNVATSFTGKVTLSLASNPGGSTLSGQLTMQAVAGVITFTDLTLSNSGSGYMLLARSGILKVATDEFSVVS